jgi:uncharacterized coiled-coil protein SlyX
MAATLEERVAYLEGKVEEQSRLGSDLREMVIHLDQKVDRFRDELASRIDATNSRIDALDQKVDRFREELMRAHAATNSRIDALDQKVSRQFTWLVGIQLAVLLALIGALLKVAP